MAKRNSFIFYRSFYDAIKKLKKNDQLTLYSHICKYALGEEVDELDGVPGGYFELIKPAIDANTKRYLNGLKGGRPITKTKPNRNQKETLMKNEECGMKNEEFKNEDEDGEGGNTHPLTPSQGDESEGVFPPTLSEVKAYCQSRNSGINPEEFYDFYASKGWMVGKSPMVDWKASLRGWERNHKEKQPHNPYADVDDWLRRRTEDDETGI